MTAEERNQKLGYWQRGRRCHTYWKRTNNMLCLGKVTLSEYGISPVIYTWKAGLKSGSFSGRTTGLKRAKKAAERAAAEMPTTRRAPGQRA